MCMSRRSRPIHARPARSPGADEMASYRSLWALEHATSETLTGAGRLAEALRLHIEQAEDGLTCVLVQIGQRQRAYLLLTGCPGCQVGRCVPGCRVHLLSRSLRAGFASAGLRHVHDGLQPRRYTRYV